MGYEMFLVLLNMSLSGALVILAVLLVRLFLRRAPKLISYCLWAVVLFKLLCPVSFSLPVSLPETENSPVVESGIVYYIPKEILYGQLSSTEPDSPVFAEGGETGALSQGVGSPIQAGETGNVVLSGGTEGTVSGEGRRLMGAAMALWAAGVALMLAHGGASVVILKRKLKGARAVSCSFGDGDQITVYEKENLPTPFVLGLFCPKIYLPAGLKESEKQYILLHEQIHIRRRDPIIKAVSFLTLCLHWFNPMVWAAFFFSERDMEMSCDEAVLRRLGSGVKSEYSATLLNLAAGRRIIGGMPLAFGEGTPGRRIRNVLKYKKPQVAAVCVGIVVAAAAALLLLANPRSGNSDGSRGQEVENADAGADGTDAEIGRKAAKTAALAHAGLSETEVADMKVEQDWDDGRLEYAVTFKSGGMEYDYTIDGVTGAVLSFEQEPDTAASEENGELRAMDRGEAFTWEILQKLTEVSLPELKDYAGYQGAVWDDMNDYALNRYLIYDLRDEEQGQDYQLLVSYMAEDSHINMIYLARESDRAELPLYREDAGWWDADITAFREHISSLADWLAEYRLPREEMLQADAFSAMVGYGGGQTFQWVGKYYPMAEPGESCPEEWKAAAVIYRTDGENLVFDADGILTGIMLWSNHSGIVTDPVPVEGCEEQAVLFQFACDLFTLPELAEAEEAGTPIPEEESTGHFWYVCFGREGASQGYMFGLNMRYFSEEDAIELARSIRFTEEAWQ